MRPIMAGAALGSSAVPPVRVWPFSTTSRLVPRAEISFSRPAEADEESPRTATMAATPMAMPSADRPGSQLAGAQPHRGQAGQVGGPQLPHCEGPRCWSWPVVLADWSTARRRHRRRRGLVGAVEDDLAVEHLDAPAHARRDVSVVGDDHDGHPQAVEFLEEPQDGLPGGLVEVAGGLVGEARWPGCPPGPGRWPRAGAARPRAGWGGRGVARRGRPVRGRRGRGRAVRPGGPRRRGGRRPRCRARSGARPGRTAGTRSRSGWPAARPAPGRRAARRRGR